MDLITLALAKNYTNQIGAAGLTSVSYDSTTSEIVAVYATDPATTIRYTIPTLQGRGILNTVLNADYTLTITYTDGTTYTTPSIRGPQGPQGEQGNPGFSPVASVSKAGKTATITITDATHTTTAQVSDGSNSVSVSATGTSTNKVKYITIDGTESKMGVDVINNVLSTATEDALSANMGKELQDQVNNLKNIGRFLAIWNSATGLPLTDPVQSGTYEYRTGDYFRVGVVSSATPVVNYKPNGSSYTPGTASTTVETESVEVGWVYYYDGSQWLAQSAGGGGTVQDVQINGTTIVASGTGIANIPKASSNILGATCASGSYGTKIVNNSGEIRTAKANDAAIEGKTNDYAVIVPSNLDKAIEEGLGNYSGTAFTDAKKTTARNTIGAWTATEYDSTAASYAENTFFYVVED